MWDNEKMSDKPTIAQAIFFKLVKNAATNV